MLTVIGTTLCTLGMPLLLTRLIDKAIPNGNKAGIFAIVGVMLLLVVIGLLCGIATSFLSSKVAMGVGKSLRSKLFAKVQTFSQTEMDAFSTSSLITRTNNDVMQIQRFLNQCLRIAIQAPIMCVCGIILAISASPNLAAVLVVSVPLMAVILIAIGKLVIPMSQKIQLKIDRLNLVMREKLTGVRVIRAFGTTEF